MTRPSPDHGTHIRATHPCAFRSGEWARIKGTAMLPVKDGEPDRACWLVEFSDGVADFWVMEDLGWRYEFGYKGIEVPCAPSPLPPLTPQETRRRD